MTITEKIKNRLDDLEANLVSGKHLGSQDESNELEVLISSASKFWSVLSDAERDFINAAKLALNDKKAWS